MQFLHTFRGDGRIGKSHKGQAKLLLTSFVIVVALVLIFVVIDDATIGNDNIWELMAAALQLSQLTQLLLQKLSQFRFSHVPW